MIEVDKYILDNGLRVVLHQDKSTPMVAVNVLYDVGAKDEQEGKTGFAHLFEHLMFGGSKHIPSYDEPLQWVGGENNAFTNNDITNYYVTLPAHSLEVALWLESDRMLQLDFSQKSLDVQKGVVVEEFKQRYLNQPYGDVWLELRPMAYLKHPYRWPTIGQKIEHIEQAKLQDVEAFFYSYYSPNNAILVISGNFEFDQAKRLIEKWFGAIPFRTRPERLLPQEPDQLGKREKLLDREVPQNAMYKVFHMCSRTDESYIAADMLSDVLSRGNSSRLYRRLVKEKQIFTSIDAYITGDIDPGLFVISGKLAPKVDFEQANQSLYGELVDLQKTSIADPELQKVKNKLQASHVFSHIDILNKAMNLAFYELISKAEDINLEILKYQKASAQEIQKMAQHLFLEPKDTTLYYRGIKNN